MAMCVRGETWGLDLLLTQRAQLEAAAAGYTPRASRYTGPKWLVLEDLLAADMLRNLACDHDVQDEPIDN